MSQTPARVPVAIVGGGISGLSTAFYLTRELTRGLRAGPVVLVEASARFGGPIGTLRRDGFLLEQGPDSFLSRPTSVLDLVEALGLGDEVVAPHPCEPALLIWARGALRALPPGMRLVLPGDLRAFLRSDLLSRAGKLRVLAEPLVPPRRSIHHPGVQDESLGAFFERRLGREVVDTLVAPVLAGIYSGDAYSLSIRSTFPRFPQMVERHGSLLRALRHLPAERGDAAAPFRSLRGGMGTLLERLLERLHDTADLELATGQRAVGLEREGSAWRLALDGASGPRTLLADAVVLAVPAFVAARLLAPHAADSAALLASVPYTSTAGVYLAYDSAEGLPRSAGIMFPRDGTWRIRGVQLGANKYDGRAPAGGALVRVFLGGVGATALVDESDEALVQACREDLDRALGLRRAPRFTEVMRYRERAPQYTVGHAERMARALARLPPGIHLVGNAYRGVGLPACIEGARDTAAALQAASGV